MRKIFNRRAGWWKLFTGSCLLSLVLLISACERSRTPCRYLIPDGYVGWVLIELNVEGASPPRVEDGHLILEIPPSGRLAAPREPEYGRWARDQFFYVGDNGVRKELLSAEPGGAGLIWGAGIGSYLEEGRPEVKVEHFFVGSRDEFQRRASELDQLMSALASEAPPR